VGAADLPGIFPVTCSAHMSRLKSSAQEGSVIPYFPGQRVWLPHPAMSSWAQVADVRGDMLMLEAEDGEPLGWKSVAQCLTEAQVQQVIDGVRRGST
jgi:hypothetical protein